MDCQECKNKPCCTDDILCVEVTLDFLFRLAKHLGITPEEAFNKYCKLLPMSMDDKFRVTVTLNQPCPFFSRDKGCKIHGIKPLTCIQFPTNVIINGLSKSYPDFPCLNGEMEEPSQQEKTISLQSSLYVYGGPYNYEIEKKVFFKDNIRILDPKEYKDKYDEIKNLLDNHKTLPEEERQKLVERTIHLLEENEVELLISKYVVARRIKKIKKAESKKVYSFNQKYFEFREK